MKTRSLEVRQETSSKEKDNKKKRGEEGKQRLKKIGKKHSGLLVFENLGICQSRES